MMPSTMIEAACAYVRKGWRLCLLRPQSKVPALHAWNDPMRVLDSEDRVRAALMSSPGAGIGLVHATSRTATVDIDHVEYARMAFAELGIDYDAMFAGAPRIRSRKGRDKIVLRLPDGFAPGEGGVPTKYVLRWPLPHGGTVTVMELRGGVNQDVLPPSIHPDTGEPYAWHDGQSPWDYEALPTLDSRLVTIWREIERFGRQLEDACPWRPVREDLPRPVVRQTTERNNGLIDRFNGDNDVASLLASHGYKQIGKRWLAPSSKTKLPGVLLLDGKVYSHHGSDPLNNGHANDAFDVYTLLEHDGDFNRAIRAIGKHYRDIDAPPQPADVSGFIGSLGDTKAEQRQRMKEMAAQPELERVEPACLRVVPFPVAGLEAMARWFDTSFDDTHPLASQAAVLALISTAAGRRYVSEYGDTSSVYLGLMTPPGAQARYTSIGIGQVLMDAGLRHMVRATRLSSPQQLYNVLWNRPAALYLAEDYGDQVRIARRQPSGLLEQTLATITGTVASGADLMLDNWQELGLKHTEGDGSPFPVIRMPALSMLATVAGAQLAKVFGQMEVSRGSIDGMLFVPCIEQEHWQQRIRMHAPQPVPVEFIERLRAMRGFAPGQTSMSKEQIDAEMGMSQPTPIIVRFTGDVQAAESALVRMYRGQGPMTRALLAGARTLLRRLCVSVAAFDAPRKPVADQRIVTWVAGFVAYCLDKVIAEASLRGSDADRPDPYQKTLEFIIEAGVAGRPRRDLISGCKPFRSLTDDKRSELLLQLHSDEQIYTMPSKSGRSQVYVCARFVNVKTQSADHEVLTADPFADHLVSSQNASQKSDCGGLLTADRVTQDSPPLYINRHIYIGQQSAGQQTGKNHDES